MVSEFRLIEIEIKDDLWRKVLINAQIGAQTVMKKKFIRL
jgi:hypothetical protein